jgi:hypothetical protein
MFNLDDLISFKETHHLTILKSFTASSGSRGVLEKTNSSGKSNVKSLPNYNDGNYTKLINLSDEMKNEEKNNKKIPYNETQKEIFSKIKKTIMNDKFAEKISKFSPEEKIILIKKEFVQKFQDIKYLNLLESNENDITRSLICYNFEHERINGFFKNKVISDLLNDKEFKFLLNKIDKNPNNRKKYNKAEKAQISKNFRKLAYTLHIFHLYIQKNVIEKLNINEEEKICKNITLNDIGDDFDYLYYKTKHCNQNYNYRLKYDSENFIQNLKIKYQNYSEIYDEIDKKKLTVKIQQIFEFFGPISPISLEKLFSCADYPNNFNPEFPFFLLESLEKICVIQDAVINSNINNNINPNINQDISMIEMGDSYINPYSEFESKLKIEDFKPDTVKWEKAVSYIKILQDKLIELDYEIIHTNSLKGDTKLALYECACLMASSYRDFKKDEI